MISGFYLISIIVIVYFILFLLLYFKVNINIITIIFFVLWIFLLNYYLKSETIYFSDSNEPLKVYITHLDTIRTDTHYYSLYKIRVLGIEKFDITPLVVYKLEITEIFDDPTKMKLDWMDSWWYKTFIVGVEILIYLYFKSK